MRRVFVVLVLVAVCAVVASLAHAQNVEVTITSMGMNDFRFDHRVTSIYSPAGAEPYPDMTGLGGFAIQVPIPAAISEISDPEP